MLRTETWNLGLEENLLLIKISFLSIVRYLSPTTISQARISLYCPKKLHSRIRSHRRPCVAVKNQKVIFWGITTITMMLAISQRSSRVLLLTGNIANVPCYASTSAPNRVKLLEKLQSRIKTPKPTACTAQSLAAALSFKMHQDVGCCSSPDTIFILPAIPTR